MASFVCTREAYKPRGNPIIGISRGKIDRAFIWVERRETPLGTIMTRKILQLLGLGALIVAATAEEHPAELVGRWRSENMPVGYWVIDRYPDGRLARKEYVRNDSSRPAEIAVTWGRWRMRGAQYGEYFESTTSPSGQGYCGKWWNVRIQRVTPHRFHHLSNDGHDTYEDRLRDRRPLPKVHQPPPRQYRWGKLTNTMTSTAVPKWVISSAPN